jgi:hypothetical protein
MNSNHGTHGLIGPGLMTILPYSALSEQLLGQ